MKQQEESRSKQRLTLYEKAITSLVSFIAVLLTIGVSYVIDIAGKVTILMVARENHEVRIQHLERDNNRPNQPRYRFPPEEIIKPDQRLLRKQ